jgi:hypothetical protein
VDPRNATGGRSAPRAGAPGLTVLLARGGTPPAGLRLVRLHLGDRVAARVAGPALDARLAAGECPDGDRLLAARARYLVRPATRHRLAGNWARLLDLAAGSRAPTRAAVPPCRARVVAAADDVRAVVGALRSPLPVPARGVATAVRLLADGTGPVFDPRAPGDLAAELRDVVRRLDPATLLTVPVAPGRGAG